jgi:acyl carrier protein
MVGTGPDRAADPGEAWMNKEKLRSCFSQSLGIPMDQVVDDLAYNSIEQWDSVGHMTLVAGIESTFDVLLDTDDILNLSSVREAVAILRRHGVDFDAA